MAKELIDGMEYLDGEPVQIYEARFGGVFRLDPEDAASLSNGDLGTCLVTFRVENPKFSHSKTGELKRANTFKVEAYSYVDPDEARFIYDNMKMKVLGVNDGLVEVSQVNKESNEATFDLDDVIT